MQMARSCFVTQKQKEKKKKIQAAKLLHFVQYT